MTLMDLFKPGQKLIHMKSGEEYIVVGKIKVKVHDEWQEYVQYTKAPMLRANQDMYARHPMDMDRKFTSLP